MWSIQSLQERGADAARSGTIDRAAPVTATAAIDIPVPPQQVWEVLTDLETWPGFMPDVARVRLRGDGVVGPGQRFTWVNAGIPIRSRIEVAAPGAELTWTGVALWLVAVHRNTLDVLPAGGCRLVSSESMAGAGAGRLMPSSRLRSQLEAFVGAVRNEAQRRCG